jgi:hypothetical protein
MARKICKGGWREQMSREKSGVDKIVKLMYCPAALQLLQTPVLPGDQG